jgi:UDP-N-acetylmuramoyl-L-alanyl-D-glutamate--2,6-diaminopimelate ligase
MGALAARHAQALVVTSDNPRNEAPGSIIDQILAGVPAGAAAVVIEDRAAAIVHAVRNADAADVILLAGKGHEEYQEIGGVRLAFSDAAQAGAALKLRSTAR